MTATAVHATAQPLTAAERGDRLRWLAEQVIEDPELHVVAFAEATKLFSPHLPAARRREAFDDYCDQVERWQGVELGDIPWYEIEPALSCPDPDVAAEQIQSQMVADALDTLLYGDR